MKPNVKGKRHMRKYAKVICVHAAILFVISFVIYLTRPARGLFYVLIYPVYSILSAYSACKMVRGGVNPYLAWMPAPIMLTAAGFLTAMGFSPDILPILISAFVSLVGAATGDVINREKKKH